MEGTIYLLRYSRGDICKDEGSSPSISYGMSRTYFNEKEQHNTSVCYLMCAGRDSNPRRPKPPRLQRGVIATIRPTQNFILKLFHPFHDLCKKLFVSIPYVYHTTLHLTFLLLAKIISHIRLSKLTLRYSSQFAPKINKVSDI